jgi:hypothetical protein
MVKTLKKEKRRLEKERLEKERLKKEKRRLEKERLEKERLKKEKRRLEKERLEKERLEKERLEKERIFFNNTNNINFFTKVLLKEYSNIKNLSNSLIKEKEIKYDDIFNYSNIYYLSYCNEHIYFKTILSDTTHDIEPYNDIISKININDPYNLIFDNTSINMNYASHNMYFFLDKENKIKAIGGKHDSDSYIDKFKDNIKFKSYFNNNKILIDSTKYNIYTHCSNKFIYNPNIPCPFYGNGLYLFDVETDIKCLNNNYPIISGLNNGYDAFYSSYGLQHKHVPNNINLCRSGLSVYDSLGSVVYNKLTNLYYLYHRANIYKKTRSIQYATSKDLLKWSEYNIVKFFIDNKEIDYLSHNIYYSNFFNIPNTNIYIGIIPITGHKKKKDSTPYIEKISIFFSYDCINYFYIDELITYNCKTLEDISFCTNYPKIYENKMFFYISNNMNKNISIYTMQKNRFFYLTNDKNKETQIKLNLLKFNEPISMNLSIEEDGYLIAELYNKNNKLISEYSFNNFDIIKNINSDNYLLTWKSKTFSDNNEIYISIKFFKAKLYTINGDFLFLNI